MTKPFLPHDPRDTSKQKVHPRFSYEQQVGDSLLKFSIGMRTDWAEMAEREITEFVIAFEDPDDEMLLSVLGMEKYFAIGWIEKNALGLWSFSGNTEHKPATDTMLKYYFISILALKNLPNRDIMVLCHVPKDREYVFKNYPKVFDGLTEDKRGFDGQFDMFVPTVLTLAIDEFMLNYIE